MMGALSPGLAPQVVWIKRTGGGRGGRLCQSALRGARRQQEKKQIFTLDFYPDCSRTCESFLKVAPPAGTAVRTSPVMSGGSRKAA